MLKVVPFRPGPLLWAAGRAVKPALEPGYYVVKRVVKPALDAGYSAVKRAAAEVAADYELRAPVTIAFDYGRLNTFPPIELRKPVIKKGPDPRTKPPETKWLDDASSAANGLRLRVQLAFQQGNVLDRNGKLTDYAIKNAKIATGTYHDGWKNPKVIEVLTRNGNRLDDWEKLKTPKIELLDGRSAEIHFYKNKVAGEVNYNIDYKNIVYPESTPKNVKRKDKEIFAIPSLRR